MLLWILTASVTLVIGLELSAQLHHFLSVDRCLDGGGRWDASIQNCDYGSN